jgi:hypothetical protein
VISDRDTLKKHGTQAGNKSNNKSIMHWLQMHCNFRSRDTYINDKPELPNPVGIFVAGKTWETVENEKSFELAEFKEYSRITYTDNRT